MTRKTDKERKYERQDGIKLDCRIIDRQDNMYENVIYEAPVPLSLTL